MEEPKELSPEQDNTPKFRGLYRYVKIPVKALDTIIIVCIAAILLVFALEMRNPGFTVTFDSKGGTDVPSQNQMYGERLELPQPPTREGYEFIGWYKDSECYTKWNVEEDTIETDITLYAGWQKKE